MAPPEDTTMTPSNESHDEDKQHDITVDVSDTKCGCAPICGPSWIQCLANPKLFTAHMMILTSFLMMSFVYLGAVLTTIERNFQLDSSESGSITIAADIISVIFVLPLSHYGQKGHGPRWIATGALFTAVGTFLCAMPHFTSKPLDPNVILTGFVGSSPQQELCTLDGEVHHYSANDNETTTSNPHLYSSEAPEDHGVGLRSIWWIVLGQIIVGIGNAPFFPLVATYIDDSVKKHNLTAYTAVLFIAFTIGPSCGFLFAAITTSKYVDFDRIPKDQIPQIDQSDPRWIGAWWLGFVLLSMIMVVLTIPVYFYPKKMPSAVKKWNQEREKEREKERLELEANGKMLEASKDAENGPDDLHERRGSFGGHLDGKIIKSAVKGPILALKRLVTNLTNMCIVFYGAAFMSMYAIFGSFGLKYVQTQFSLSPSEAALVTAIILGPPNILSQIVSAYICRRFKLNSKQCALFSVIGIGVTLFLLPFAMVFGCDNVPIAGVTATYNDTELPYVRGLSADCNMGCSCSDSAFRPICGADGLTYISPCHAGCQSMQHYIGGDDMIQRHNYTDCQCIANSLAAFNEDNVTQSPVMSVDGVSGPCPVSCPLFKPYVGVLLLMFFIESLVQNPGMYVAVRCVEERDRSMAIGLRSLVGKVLGFFPAPVYFGAIINSVCILWQTTDGEQGACWIYDNARYRYAYFGTTMVLHALAFFFLVLMYFSIKEPLREKKKSDVNEYDPLEKDEVNANTTM